MWAGISVRDLNVCAIVARASFIHLSYAALPSPMEVTFKEKNFGVEGRERNSNPTPAFLSD